jgi:hypothetical protein
MYAFSRLKWRVNEEKDMKYQPTGYLLRFCYVEGMHAGRMDVQTCPSALRAA